MHYILENIYDNSDKEIYELSTFMFIITVANHLKDNYILLLYS